MRKSVYVLAIAVLAMALPAFAQTRRAQVSAIMAMQSGIVPPAPRTWYVRKGGSDRTRCDGLADVDYSGTGTGIQHCAFGEYRSLYDDQKGNMQWVFAGGDRVILRDGAWRVGYSQGLVPNDPWGSAGLGPQGSEAPPLPAGYPTQHTQILGENYASCSDTNKTELFGGFGIYHVLSLAATSYVDVKCIGITRHSQCIQHGDPAVPGTCSRDYPWDDYAVDGVVTDQGTHDVLMQDVDIHGFPDRGIIGAIGGLVTCLHCRISYNGMVGWDFDDGMSSLPNINNATWSFVNSILEYSGCNQAYPGTGAISCYSQSSSGTGDGMATGSNTALNINIDHSIFRYNTQDCIDPGHVDTGSSTLSITNSTFYGCGGAQLKWGYNFSSATVTGNTFLGNCVRMSAPLTGNAAAYNAHLGDFCRSGSTFSWNYRDGQKVNFSNNTIISYGPGLFTWGCSTIGGCPNASTIFQNNVIRGYDNPSTYNFGGKVGGPSFTWCQDNTTVDANGGAVQMDCAKLGVFTRANNVFFGVRGVVCNPTEKCVDPFFVGEPAGTGPTFTQAELDGYNTAPQTGSPATGLGAAPQLVGTASPVVTPVPIPIPTPVPVPTPIPTPAPVTASTTVTFAPITVTPAKVKVQPPAITPPAITVQPPAITVTPPPMTLTCTATPAADGKSIASVVCK